jgi:hypothetical protein
MATDSPTATERVPVSPVALLLRTRLRHQPIIHPLGIPDRCEDSAGD